MSGAPLVGVLPAAGQVGCPKAACSDQGYVRHVSVLHARRDATASAILIEPERPSGGRWATVRASSRSPAATLSSTSVHPQTLHAFVGHSPLKPGPTERGLQAALFVERVDGSGLHQITPFGFIFPHDDQAWASWSPDGRTIVSTTAHGTLFTVAPDGSNLTIIRLTTEAKGYFAFDPDWSPDGTRIVFAMYTNEGEDLYTADPDGTNLEQITDDADIEHSPHWG
jgi:Tol biopolymer transport system component